jgi:hypothetical protein
VRVRKCAWSIKPKSASFELTKPIARTDNTHPSNKQNPTKPIALRWAFSLIESRANHFTRTLIRTIVGSRAHDSDVFAPQAVLENRLLVDQLGSVWSPRKSSPGRTFEHERARPRKQLRGDDHVVTPEGSSLNESNQRLHDADAN